ncbi:MAG: DeoR/GlpR family DNA-binding transcription regulator [Oscillospiraceae bacterium]|nr:DeoR/GlpR family DNA-binding transcription regulator [Oscillospiraceae bacterium]
MNSIRREKVRAFVEKNGVATLGQLSALLPEVSLMTLHRDLSFLQEQGFLQKIRGGAKYVGDGANEPTFAAREIVNKPQKLVLAEKAAEFLDGVSSIFIDAGTTMMAFAKGLPDMPFHILTTSPNIALELAKKQFPSIELCGGTLNKSNLTLSGESAALMLTRVNIDTAFLAPAGYGETTGFTCGRESEAKLKSLVIEKARRTVLMMDTSKLERLLPYTFAKLQDADYLVTELSPDQLPRKLIEQSLSQKVTLI